MVGYYYIQTHPCLQHHNTCLNKEAETAGTGLVDPGSQVEVDGERLSPPHDETIKAIEVGAVVRVVELALQVPTDNVQSLGQ